MGVSKEIGLPVVGTEDGGRRTEGGSAGQLAAFFTTDDSRQTTHDFATPLDAGYLWGFMGVLAFSLTLPATRAAAPELGGTIVGLGRAIVAALLAALLLIAMKERPPAREYWRSLAIVALGVVIGFPLLTAFALQNVPAAHGAVFVGLLPAMTAVMAVLRGGERPPPAFWLACAAGVAAVLVFAVVQGAGRPQAADLLLLGAVAAAALGYAEGGRLARALGGWRVICWALIISVPVLIVPVGIAVTQQGLDASPRAWLGFAYVSMVSMFLGFFAWYRGLALGGIARVGQIQLVQPVLTLLWAALFLGEVIDVPTAVAGLLVVASVALTRLSWTGGRKPASRQDGESARRQDGESARRQDGESARRRVGKSARRRDGKSASRRDGESARRHGPR